MNPYASSTAPFQAASSHEPSIVGATPVVVMAILACEHHIELIETLLDESGVPTWTCLPACQSRRLRFLQNVPGRHSETPCLFLAFATPDIIRRATKAILGARAQGDLCAECTVFDWNVREIQHGAVALDPVCEEVVDCEQAPSLNLGDETFYFCSTQCRDEFSHSPDQYLARREAPYRIDRRDLVSSS